MSKAQQVKFKIPVIYYEDPDEDQGANPIPYIPMDQGEDWPTILFIQEYRDTGEIEPDDQGNPQPICDVYMHKFVDMEFLKDNLDAKTNDIVRVALGMEPLEVAKKKGAQILDKVYNNVNTTKEGTHK